MYVWNRLECRWVKWHGSAAAWRRLPHAVKTAVCSGAMSTLLAMPPHPHMHRPHSHAAPPAPQASHRPVRHSDDVPFFPDQFTGALTGGLQGPLPQPPGTGGPPTVQPPPVPPTPTEIVPPVPRPTTSVPEPSSLALLATGGLILLGLRRKRGRTRRAG